MNHKEMVKGIDTSVGVDGYCTDYGVGRRSKITYGIAPIDRGSVVHRYRRRIVVEASYGIAIDNGMRVRIGYMDALGNSVETLVRRNACDKGNIDRGGVGED